MHVGNVEKVPVAGQLHPNPRQNILCQSSMTANLPHHVQFQTYKCACKASSKSPEPMLRFFFMTCMQARSDSLYVCKRTPSKQVC